MTIDETVGRLLVIYPYNYKLYSFVHVIIVKEVILYDGLCYVTIKCVITSYREV